MTRTTVDFKISNMKRPEILSPCGTWEALEAAVKGGADAVYLGGTLFSARAFAGNFDKEELLRAIDYCHFYDVSLYMALNTLLKEDEIMRVPSYMEPYADAGLDGVIIQDLGIAKVLRDSFPGLPLHASTQMSISSGYGARFLKECGFTRIVPARELSLSEIKSIKEKADIEIETFVHGAMCYAYSGKCLMSSFIGGRSGNRGRCAQPCRQCWDMKCAKAQTEGYVMSMKDMCMIGDLPKLIEAGIDSFKIEGRMKNPAYVAQVTAAYRTAVDMYFDGVWDRTVVEELTDRLKDVYNRGGFSTGYYFDQNGRHMLADRRPNHTGLKIGTVAAIEPPKVKVRLTKDINAGDVLEIRPDEPDPKAGAGVELTSSVSFPAGQVMALNGKEFKRIKKGMGVFRTRNNALLQSIEKEILEPEKKIEAMALVEARIGSPLTISVWKDGTCVSVSGNVVTEASNRPADEAVITGKMNKTGGSNVALSVSCSLDKNAFVQMSELNSLRREAVAAFRESYSKRERRR